MRLRVKEGAMPRLARLDAPGVIHHIIIRGIEHRKIFQDNRDRENFLDRFGKSSAGNKDEGENGVRS